MGAAGVFFWQPHPDGVLKGWNRKQEARHATERGEGKWGCVPLLPGDLFLAAGTFQHHVHHGSLSYTEAADIEQVLSKYQACNEARAVLFSPRYQQYFDSTMLEDKSVLTFRRIERHRRGCPVLCPSGPPLEGLLPALPLPATDPPPKLDKDGATP